MTDNDYTDSDDDLNIKLNRRWHKNLITSWNYCQDLLLLQIFVNLLTWNNGLVDSALDSSSGSSRIKTAGSLQDQLNLLPFQGKSNQYKEFLRTQK